MQQASNAEAIDPALRARLHARFPKAARWTDPAEEAPSPWELIRHVLVRGRADGLNDMQMAGGIYTVLVSHGHMDGGRA